MGPPKREQIEREYRWDLSRVFESSDAWEQKFRETDKELERFDDYRGDLSEPGRLLEAVQLYEEVMRKVDVLNSYARMKSDEDTREQGFQGLLSRAKSLRASASSATSFLEPEIQSLGREEIERRMEDEPMLRGYYHFFDRILRMESHTRSDEVEKVLAELGDVLGSWDTYNMLSNADMSFPTVRKPDGTEVEITPSNFTSLQKNPDREFRREVYEEFYDRFADFRNTMGATLEKGVKTSVRMAGVRDYDSAREAALYPSKIPTSVYDNLVDTVRERLGLLHRHLALKQRVLGVDKLNMWDVYMPAASTESPEVSYPEAKKHVLEAIAPLGERYRLKAEEGLESRWVDVYENRGKRSGAYSGGAYDTSPYILMNYQDDINSMYTLAHELGHSMHSYFTCEEQPYVYSDYGIFVAEVASTVNEALLTRHLLENADSESFRRHVLSHYLENFRTTIFRQTMFADFEQVIHREVEEGGALTPDLLDEKYGGLKREFYSPAEIDERIAGEWMRIPHFYWDFYVFQYATGMSAAVALSQKIVDEGPGDYLSFLESGGSMYPLDLLELAGVDMASPRPIETALDVYADYLGKADDLVG